MTSVASSSCPMLTISRMPPHCMNWLMVSTSAVTRDTSDPRCSVAWCSTDRSWMWRKARTRSAAMVFQHSFLFDDTIRSNITLGEDGAPGEDGARFDDVAVRAAARLAQADGFIEALPSGYDTVIGERGTSLSGGQRQRIALARALV